MPEQLSLEDELVALGRTLVVEPTADDLVDSVLARLVPDVGPGTTRRRPVPRRLGWAVAAAVVLVLALIPPVRAAVVELLRIGGVVVRQEPAPSVPPVSPTGGGAATSGARAGDPGDRVTPVSLERAEQIVGGDIELPTLLGPPTSVGIGHDGRVVEVMWAATEAAGPVRLDVFVGSLSWGYLKTVHQSVTPVSMGGREGVWLGADHLVEWVDRTGATHTEPPRLAGPTLVWVVPSAPGDLTYRLEGAATLERALAVARSAR